MKLSYPVQQTYVVLQLDPVAMVQHLNDPAALEEARSMTPKKYLVYISMVCTLFISPRYSVSQQCRVVG